MVAVFPCRHWFPPRNRRSPGPQFPRPGLLHPRFTSKRLHSHFVQKRSKKESPGAEGATGACRNARDRVRAATRTKRLEHQMLAMPATRAMHEWIGLIAYRVLGCT